MVSKNYCLRCWNVFLFLLLLPLITSCGGKKTIVNGLDEKEANEIIVYLSTKGIEVNKVKVGEGAKVSFDIAVDPEKATEAMSLLNQVGLPRRRGTSLLGIFGNAGLVPSELEQKIRYEAGLAEQIASTIRKIDGVLDAEVQISFPQEDPLNPGQFKGKITSSVYVKHAGVLDDPNSHLIAKIRRLVASSVTGLEYDNVTVIPDRARFSDFPGGVIVGGDEEKEFVTIWSVVLAKESATRFRGLFFTFSILILILLLMLIWILWKVTPLLKRHGGMRKLFSLRPIKMEQRAPAPKAEAMAPAEDAGGTEQVNARQIIEDAEKDIDES
jgi:type III secretion protein J